MDAADKTERIAAPSGKHDDYCDSSVMGVHAALSMMPASATFASVQLSTPTPRMHRAGSIPAVFKTGGVKNRVNKHIPGGI
jgi:hypothetical protein